MIFFFYIDEFLNNCLEESEFDFGKYLVKDVKREFLFKRYGYVNE